MRYKTIIAAITISLLTGLFISLHLIGTSHKSSFEVDMIYINEVVKETEQGKAYTGKRVYDYYVVKNTDSNYDNQLNTAIRNRDIIVELWINEEHTGNIIFFMDLHKQQENITKCLQITVSVIFLMIFVICCLYVCYLYHTIYKPFQKLKKFARLIALGNLEIPLEMDKNNFFGAFTESFDIMREELKMAKHKENLANISKRELIASLSHDIKTPISSIKAVGELLFAIVEDQKCRKKVTVIIEKAEQIDRLITDMFNSTLEELGELKVTNTEQYSGVLYELIQIADYQSLATSAPIPECIVSVDMLRLGQVLNNIFANSYKYANTKIDVLSRITENHLEIDIADYGNGISDDELPLLLNKFYRGSNVGGKSGAGLGLFISKYLMEKQGGDIQCYNSQHGFLVKLILPLV